MAEVLGEEELTERGWRDDPPVVTAVLVLHDGAHWLPGVLDALLAQTHAPDELVVVDVGSRDGGPDLVTRRLAGHPVLNAPPGAGFGEAVDFAVAHARPGDHLWLLHDDCAPAPDALARLLDEATLADDVAAVGPKVREWPSLRRLVEVGVTITGTGHRETGLERGEPDQGQHDRPRDVLAVGSAGMLVRRDAWERLGGFDPALPRYGDDLDFGWRANRAGLRVRVAPRAVVFHAEAASRSLRPDGLPGSPVREQRRAALFTLLANASPAGFAWQSVRLAAGSVLRVLALLLAKAPGEARDELVALVRVYGRPGAMVAARRRRAAAATVPHARVRRLLPSPAQPYQHGLDSLVDVVSAVVRPGSADGSGRRASAPGRRMLDPTPQPEARGRRGPLLVAVVLVVAAVVAARGVLGAGSLTGGALLAAPDQAGAWWSLLVSDARAPAYVVALAAPATLVWGQPGLVLETLVLGAVPLAALTGHRFVSRLVLSRGVTAWWALTWALGVVACGAVAQGRLGTVAALVVLPLAAGAAVDLLRDPGWQPGFRLAAWLGLATAFAPLTLAVLVPAVVGAAALRRPRGVWPPLLVALVLAVLVAWPRSLAEAGLSDALTVPVPSVPDLLAGRGAGPGSAPAWLAAGVVVGALAALLRTDRRDAVLAWAVGLPSLAVAVLAAGHLWIGLPAAAWSGSLALAAALVADGWRTRLVPVVAVLCLAGTVATASWWLVRGVEDPLRRGPAVDVPAYLADRAEAGSATLVLDGDRRDGVTWTLVRDDGPRTGDEAVPDDGAVDDALVRRVVTSPGPGAVATLARDGVGALYLPAPVDDALASDLDALAGLSRSGTPDDGSRAWTVDDAVERQAPAASVPSRLLAWGHLVLVALVVVLALPARRGRRR